MIYDRFEGIFYRINDIFVCLEADGYIHLIDCGDEVILAPDVIEILIPILQRHLDEYRNGQKDKQGD